MILNKTYSSIFLFLFSTLLLGLGFYNNRWKAANQDWFAQHQLDTESLVIGRMVKSRRDGIFSSGGLPGQVLGGQIQEDVIKSQYEAYYKNWDFETFSPYYSQIGFQGITLSLLDKITPFSSEKNIKALKWFNSMLFALTLSIIIVWFYLEFGLISSVTVLLTTLFSQWVTVFGRNLWWVMWAFYLPFIASLFILILKKKSYLAIILTFITVFIKCLYNGYEYITTTILMMLTPYIYYSIIERWQLKLVVKKVSIIVTTAIVTVLSSTIILAYQISAVTGSFKKGLHHIFIYSVGKRTHGDATNYPQVYADSLNAGTLEVIDKYLKGIIFDFNNFFNTSYGFSRINYLTVIVLFAVFSCLIYLSKHYPEKVPFRKICQNRRKLSALAVSTWFSFLAPLSWFVIFKGHSYIHTHMNYITWHMPFTLLGFALFGLIGFYLVSEIFDTLHQKRSSRRISAN
ncbi:TPA: hypothetical protein EYP66_24375 [Candidatus Poribacteria bacterium]|nr:hypothetical protein [Candidatus Poribacteria bacterium]